MTSDSSVQIACTACGAKLRIRSKLVGQKIKCPKCEQRFTAISTATPPSAAAPPRPKAKPPVSPSPPSTTPALSATTQTISPANNFKRKKALTKVRSALLLGGILALILGIGTIAFNYVEYQSAKKEAESWVTFEMGRDPFRNELDPTYVQRANLFFAAGGLAVFVGIGCIVANIVIGVLASSGKSSQKRTRR